MKGGIYIMANKMTRIEAINVALSVVTDEEALQVLSNIKASLEKKSTTPKKPNEEQIAIREAIKEVLSSVASPVSISEMQKLSEVLAPLSTSKVSANVTQLLEKNGGPIVRTMEKKTAKFIINA